MIQVVWQTFENADAMTERAAADIASIIETAVRTKGSALMAVPGGSTPAPIFRSLGTKIRDWSRATILPTDDRLVAGGDPLSNFGLLQEEFGTSGATLATLVESPGGDPYDAGRAADAQLRLLRWPIDLVWLGMGTDGHIASILPGPDLDAASDEADTRLACGVTPDPLPKEAPVARVTLTLTALTRTHNIVLTITGTEKRAVAEKASPDTAIGRLLAAADVPVHIYWAP